MIRVAGVLCVWLSVACSPAVAASCWVPAVRILQNQTVQRDMLVVSGKRCSLVVYQTPGPIHGARLIAPPKNGRVSIVGGRVTYISRPGYVGDDRFVFAREGTDTTYQPVTWTIEMNVQVKERL